MGEGIGEHLASLTAAIAGTMDSSIDALLGAAFLDVCTTEADAVSELRAFGQMSEARASHAVRAGREILTGEGDTAAERLSGVRFPDAVWARVTRLANSRVQAVAPSLPPLRSLLRRASQGDWEYLARRLTIDDLPTRLGGILLMASRHPSADDLQGLLRAASRLDPPHRDVMHDRAIAALYVASTYAAGGLRLGDRSWDGATPSWRADAAPWVLAAANTDDGTALARLLDAARALELGFVQPGTDPFDLEPAVTWYGDVRDRAASSAHLLLREPQWPTWFEDPDTGVQILLSADDDYAVAWVGARQRGILVSFDLGTFSGFALGEAGAEVALGLAISWYVDCTVQIEKQSASPRSTLFGRSRTGTHVKYTPTASYRRQYQDVKGGMHAPPRAHLVAAHIRHLRQYTPNPDHVAAAPRRLWQQMGPNDTWVSAHPRGKGGSAGALEVRLSRYSALADALGLVTEGCE